MKLPSGVCAQLVGVGQFGCVEVEQVIDIPVQALWPAGEEITRSQANGREALKHCEVNGVWSLVGAAGVVCRTSRRAREVEPRSERAEPA